MKHRRRRPAIPYFAALASVGTVAAMVAVPAAATADPCPVGQIVGGNVLCEPIFTPGDGLAAPPPPGLGGPPRVVPVTPPCQPPKVLSGVLCVEVGPPAAAPAPVVVAPPAPVALPARATPPHRVTPVPLPRPHPLPPLVRQSVAPPRPAPPPALTPPAPVEPAPTAPAVQDCPPQEALVTIRVAWVPLRVGL
jgi:ribonuclease E